MKRIYVLIIAVLISSSCNKHDDKFPKYEYAISSEIPDSLKSKKLEFITKGMSATDYRLTTSDYEDPEDVVYALGNEFDETFIISVEGLNIITYSNNGNGYQYQYNFIPYNRLDSNQKKIFDCLKSGNKDCY